MKKFVLLSALVGMGMFAAGNASAVMGLLTLTGTAEMQGTATNKDVTFPAAIKRSISQKDLLLILENATGDTSITNKPTKIFYDPDALNTNATAWLANTRTVTTNIYGIFYYSNSMSGLVPLDGTTDGIYHSYMEFDFFNSVDKEVRWVEGFWNPYGMEANSATTQSANGFTETANAILYVHSTADDFDLLGTWGGPSFFYAANDMFGFDQQFALVLHGTIAFKASFTQTKNGPVETESFSLKGSGDIDYNFNDGTVSGTATFSAKGPNELF